LILAKEREKMNIAPNTKAKTKAKAKKIMFKII